MEGFVLRHMEKANIKNARIAHLEGLRQQNHRTAKSLLSLGWDQGHHSQMKIEDDKISELMMVSEKLAVENEELRRTLSLKKLPVAKTQWRHVSATRN